MKQTDFSYPRCFTVHYNAEVSELKSPIFVSTAFDENTEIPTFQRKYIGIWDTGATNTVISTTIVNDYQLKPIDVAKVHHAGGTSLCNVYWISLKLPNDVIIPTISVTEGGFEEEEYNILIGMDIIRLGDFAVTNKHNKTVFSFRYPSIECIDFVASANQTI